MDVRELEACARRAVTLHQRGELEQAIGLYRTVLRHAPDLAWAHLNLGSALKARGELDAAIRHLEQAVASDRNLFAAWLNLGNTLYDVGRSAAALEPLRSALALQPDQPLVHNSLGNVLRDLRRSADADAHYRQALVLRPDYADAHANLGHLERERGHLAGAIECYRNALAIDPEYPGIRGNLSYLRRRLCDWSETAPEAQRILDDVAAGRGGTGPFELLSLTDSATAQLQCARTYARRHRLDSRAPLWNGERYGHAKIRVAYISADFREHPTAYLMAGVLEAHDRDRFTVHGVSLAPTDDSETGRRIRQAFCHYHDTQGLADRSVASLLREAEVDIAVDLMGYTRGSRAGLFGYRPAPVQVSYLGFPATMGTGRMDYLIADRYVIPDGAMDAYAEKRVCLPDCYQANDSRRHFAPQPPTRAECGLPDSAFVFCSFNNSYKITPAFFAAWMRLLQRVPGSVLWLVGSQEVQGHLRDAAVRLGVDPARLVFANRLPYAQHLARLQAADLFLDTLPYNAGTTASDALWAGVPLVTCSGEAFTARMAGSLLHAVGLPELVTQSLEDYEGLAFQLATTPPLLQSLRERLRDARTTAALFDTHRFTRNLEAAFVAMHERAESGGAPAALSVDGNGCASFD